MKTLSVLPSGSAMVPDYLAMAAGKRAYVGRKWDESLGDGIRTQGGWVPTGEIVVLEPGSPQIFAAYLQHLRDGDLLPADEQTAALCGKPKPIKSGLVSLTTEMPEEGSEDHG